MLRFREGRVRIYTSAVAAPVQCQRVEGDLSGALNHAIPLGRMENYSDTADGPEATIVVGLAQLDGAETTLVEHAGARSIARDQGLHAKLLALLGP